MGRMSERKSAPIIAAMDAERAQSLTIMLAEQKKLPDMPQDGSAPTLAPSNVGDGGSANDANTPVVN
jgi:flagellar motility protein MotE (MotC chaperone)